MSRNAPEASLRAFAATRAFGLDIATDSFTGGGPVAPLLKAWEIDLFLSNDAADVEAVAKLGVAFDGDCVLFDAHSDGIYERDGLDAFLGHESENVDVAMGRGPFSAVLAKLEVLRRRRLSCGLPARIRTALVTARSAPAHARALNTLEAWGTPIDEAHFVGQGKKGGILAAFGAHIFFDDRAHHVLCASRHVAAALVPNGETDRRIPSREGVRTAQAHPDVGRHAAETRPGRSASKG